MPDRVESLLRQLTLDEKASLTAGRDAWHTPPIERLGIPPMKVSDGPNGVRGGDFAGSVTSACFPVGVALGATWDPALIEELGRTIAAEARAKGVHVVLGPTINLHRTPLAGRNFECYSEDPLHAGRIAAAFVRGVQGEGIGACPKHFVANDSEFERFTISSEVDERTLRELYLRPFEIVVKEADPWSIMGAYNRVNGEFACEHEWLLTRVLRDEWSFSGFVVSDWGATHSTVESARAGLDLEMPGPAQHLGPRLADAVRTGQVDETTVDAMAHRLLIAMERTGALDDGDEVEERADDRPEVRELARRLATEAMVLLRNDGGLLPLDPGALRRVAIIGPNAAIANIQGGGSSGVTPHYAITPLDGIRERLGEARIVHEHGCANHRTLPEIDPGWLRAPDGATGVRVEYFDGPLPEGDPASVTAARRLRSFWFGDGPPGIGTGTFAARVTGTLTVPEPGEYSIGLGNSGRAKLFLDGNLVIDNWTERQSGEVTATVRLDAGRSHDLRVEYSREGAGRFAGFRVGLLAALPDDAMERAVDAARDADAAIVVVGLNGDWETEGEDRETLALPGEQDELVRRVLEANPRTVVVLQSGAPVTLPWLEEAPAVVQAWYPGQECGNAIAAVLFGDAEPGGRLGTTWPARLEDTPAFTNYPGEAGRVLYGERVFMGYRWYDSRGIAPVFPFGHGGGYTTFRYGELQTDRDTYAPRDPVRATIEIENIGERPGKEVVQLYVHDPEASVQRPEQELRAFEAVRLASGERTMVTFSLDERAFAYWDAARGEWTVEPGAFELRAGHSSADIRARATITVTAPER